MWLFITLSLQTSNSLAFFIASSICLGISPPTTSLCALFAVEQTPRTNVSHNSFYFLGLFPTRTTFPSPRVFVFSPLFALRFLPCSSLVHSLLAATYLACTCSCFSSSTRLPPFFPGNCMRVFSAALFSGRKAICEKRRRILCWLLPTVVVCGVDGLVFG